MSRKKIVQLISIAFLVAGVLLLLPGTNWRDSNSKLAFFSVLLGTAGSVISVFIPSSYAYYFTDNDWVDGEDGEKSLLIKASKHGQGPSPRVQIFIKEDTIYKEVLTDLSHNSSGDVTVTVAGILQGDGGKVIIS